MELKDIGLTEKEKKRKKELNILVQEYYKHNEIHSNHNDKYAVMGAYLLNLIIKLETRIEKLEKKMSYREERIKLSKKNAGIKWSDEQLKTAGIDKRRLKKLYRLLDEAGEIMDDQNLELYGASGSGHILHVSHPAHTKNCKPDFGSIVIDIGPGWWDGGDW